jgi:hypothetical protein
MRCWGSTESGQNRKYRSYVQSCLSEESIFVFDNVRTGWIDFDHLLLESKGMHPLRFYKLFESRFGVTARMAGSEEDFTEFRCNTEFVTNAGLPLRTALCVRAYKRFPGLYDFWLRAATLNQWDKGLMSTLWVSGASYGNGRRFVERYLDSLAAESSSRPRGTRQPVANN